MSCLRWLQPATRTRATTARMQQSPFVRFATATPVSTSPAAAAANASAASASTRTRAAASAVVTPAPASGGSVFAKPLIVRKLNLKELISRIGDLRPALHRSKQMVKVRALMERYDATSAESVRERRRFEFWDPAIAYTRNLIATDNKTYTLLQLCWNPGASSPVHNHNGSECIMRMIDGVLIERRFAMPDPTAADSNGGGSLPLPLKVVGRTVFSGPDAVSFINDSVGLHAVGNPSLTAPAISLHCYVPGYDTCRSWPMPHPNPATNSYNSQSVQSQIAYHSVFGRRTTPPPTATEVSHLIGIASMM